MTQTKLPISVLILAKTPQQQTAYERQQLERAVHSASFAQEVKIVTHSQPIKDFAHARNMALKQATYDWVFFLDSDEWFSAQSEYAVRDLLADTHIAGIAVKRVDVFHGKPLLYGETGSHYLLRFMRKDKSCYIRPVHEAAQITGTVITHDLTIWHESHLDISEFWQTISIYSELEASWRHTNHPNIPWFLVLLELCTYPFGKFVLNYILKAGWLDGWQGLIYALLMSCHSLLVRIYWLEKILTATKK